MNRLLAFALCLSTLLPAVAAAGQDDNWGRQREGRGRQLNADRYHERGGDREGRDSRFGRNGRDELRYRMARTRRHDRVDFLLRGGYALNGERRDQMGTDGSFHRGDLAGGVTGELGFRYWVARGLGIGLTAGYTDLGRTGGDGIYPMPMTGQADGNLSQGGMRPPRVTAFPVNAVVTCRLPVRSFVRPYAEIGAGVAVLSGGNRGYDYAVPVVPPDPGGIPTPVPDPGYYYQGNSQSVNFDCLGGAGLELHAGRLGFTLGARYTVISARGDAYNHASFLAGVVIH